MSYLRDFAQLLGVLGVGSHAYRNVLPALHHLPVRLVAFAMPISNSPNASRRNTAWRIATRRSAR